ncbi:DUF2812 domain-containing protein [Marinicella litoralis]|uniref:Uncharacterized protein DUF2812 n=1 Tax=Marinicella litoralis TaxID=644220 RepID=A0A4R6XW47_9GAMM|nr:DUF2812 domain-containing protein [Marinicella litoralis]TDR20708.1 uncharacterized protein DUF2812 [Marinicella litoralis]
MKTKYIMNGGLAFSEKKDIKKLEKLAAEGWLLEGLAWGGFCYKLVQGPAQDLIYTIDFQATPDSDYFDIFKSAGWRHITSSGQQIHIFAAPKGTPPIYSGNEIEEGKYQDFTVNLGKGALYSFLIMLVFMLLMYLSKSYYAFMYYPLFALTLISSMAFIFCFMPYLSYKFKAQAKQ